MKLNSKCSSAGVLPGTVAKKCNELCVVVLMPAWPQDFAQRESGYVY
ncbi:Uncharacterised protein [Citrobacter werkmanii]|uniref:Uncharacterized protein n=1 Tax=Citrobacter werkmanii TaxID=67827 RepID=A0A9N8GTF7_9ENTR|nr:hypothetical protein [Citrobacter werkmanii]UBX44189.1 hypothetical protein LD024_20015 [Citrobacter werkmanii]CAB5520716.1 Uncharacterised protein [Citrobacter werkmanii]CAB5534002.1 Uncharacterised protein [Citrobacter werkmanii]CAB5541995.1 Uncharacterised protein [Citrobacter werkmanii]CAB5542322.1 Uncharacterised protein [Citrobacter werkmanii]